MWDWHVAEVKKENNYWVLEQELEKMENILQPLH